VPHFEDPFKRPLWPQSSAVDASNHAASFPGPAAPDASDALDDIAQIDERIDVQVLAALHQRTQDAATARSPRPRQQPGKPAGGASQRSRTLARSAIMESLAN
jgi:hypothetical protein